MLLLTRAVLDRATYTPAVQVVYSSAKAREAEAAVVSQVANAGGRVADRGDVQLFVYASRHETPDPAEAFAGRIAQAITNGRRVVVADIDPRRGRRRMVAAG